MKKLSVLGICAAIAVIPVGCSDGGSRFSTDAPTNVMRDQGAASTTTSPDGQKQFGSYTWVWKSRSFKPVKGPVSVTALCPAGDVVLGGGVLAGPLFSDISNSIPTANFDGWRVHFYKDLVGGTFTVTVYASCAPAQ